MRIGIHIKTIERTALFGIADLTGISRKKLVRTWYR